MRGSEPADRSLPDGIVAVVRQGERVLVIQRGQDVPGPGYWALPSGKVEPGEAQDMTVVREVREEVGLEVRPIGKVWECVATTGSHLLHWWLAEMIGGELRLDPREVSDARWVTPEEYCAFDKTFETDRLFFRNILPHCDDVRKDI